MTALAYSARTLTADGMNVVRLTDPGHQTEVSIVPGRGNICYELIVNGHQTLYFPFQSLATWAAAPVQVGIPFLAPWANRLGEDAFFANGKRYRLNPDLLPLERDPLGQVIHGLLLYARGWQVASMAADNDGAQVVSRLDFWRFPDWMAQFPFAHSIEMTYRLAGGVLEVRVSIENLSTDPMPLVIGFHPWFQLTDSPRDQWSVHVPARIHYLLSSRLIPTGETQPAGLPEAITLGSGGLDNVFGEVEGSDEFTLTGRSQKIAVRFGPLYPVAVVYAPAGRPYVCFEPMTGITNAFNLAQAGLYKGLQSIAPGSTWTESFWVTPSGF